MPISEFKSSSLEAQNLISFEEGRNLMNEENSMSEELNILRARLRSNRDQIKAQALRAEIAELAEKEGIDVSEALSLPSRSRTVSEASTPILSAVPYFSADRNGEKPTTFKNASRDSGTSSNGSFVAVEAAVPTKRANIEYSRSDWAEELSDRAEHLERNSFRGSTSNEQLITPGTGKNAAKNKKRRDNAKEARAMKNAPSPPSSETSKAEKVKAAKGKKHFVFIGSMDITYYVEHFNTLNSSQFAVCVFGANFDYGGLRVHSAHHCKANDQDEYHASMYQSLFSFIPLDALSISLVNVAGELSEAEFNPAFSLLSRKFKCPIKVISSGSFNPQMIGVDRSDLETRLAEMNAEMLRLAELIKQV